MLSIIPNHSANVLFLGQTPSSVLTEPERPHCGFLNGNANAAIVWRSMVERYVTTMFKALTETLPLISDLISVILEYADDWDVQFKVFGDCRPNLPLRFSVHATRNCQFTTKERCYLRTSRHRNLLVLWEVQELSGNAWFTIFDYLVFQRLTTGLKRLFQLEKIQMPLTPGACFVLNTKTKTVRVV